MTHDKIGLGHHGETLASEYLKKQGYVILEANYKNILGEIDLIAKDKMTLCFVEVKTRTSSFIDSPFEAISKTKQHKISQVALAYLKEKKLFDHDARFDVVAITRQQGTDHVELLKNAFELSKPYSY